MTSNLPRPSNTKPGHPEKPIMYWSLQIRVRWLLTSKSRPEIRTTSAARHKITLPYITLLVHTSPFFFKATAHSTLTCYLSIAWRYLEKGFLVRIAQYLFDFCHHPFPFVQMFLLAERQRLQRHRIRIYPTQHRSAFSKVGHLFLFFFFSHTEHDEMDEWRDGWRYYILYS